MKTEENNIWFDDITELERFFQIIDLSAGPVRLDKCSMITDVSLFIKSHLDIVRGQNGNLRYTPYLDRLNELKLILSLN